LPSVPAGQALAGVLHGRHPYRRGDGGSGGYGGVNPRPSGSNVWREERIAKRHDRKSFDCGEPALNEYLDRFARQNHESVAQRHSWQSPPEPSRVLGYYAINPGSIEFARVPAGLTKKLGRYEVPVFLLARLAARRIGGSPDWR
jgi:hypothetical protein